MTKVLTSARINQMILKRGLRSKESWIGVDLDGTLAMHQGYRGMKRVGAPVPEMVERIKGWLEKGIEVRIFTARITCPGYDEEVIRRFLERCELPRDLVITNVKDLYMIELWDDIAVQVVRNTGKRVDGK